MLHRRPRHLLSVFHAVVAAALMCCSLTIAPPAFGADNIYGAAGEFTPAKQLEGAGNAGVYEAVARFRGNDRDGDVGGEKKAAADASAIRVCGFTAPARSAEEDAEAAHRDHDVRVWLEAMRERAAAGGDVWTDLELRVATRGAGPVAL